MLKISCLHPWDAEAAGELFHFRGGLFLALGNGFLDAFEDEVFEELRIARVNDGRVDLDREHVARAGGDDVDLATADGGLDGLDGEFFLLGGEPGLHLLGLFHEFGDVHKNLDGVLLALCPEIGIPLVMT